VLLHDLVQRCLGDPPPVDPDDVISMAEVGQ
jgi:hypothetical protein